MGDVSCSDCGIVTVPLSETHCGLCNASLFMSNAVAVLSSMSFGRMFYFSMWTADYFLRKYVLKKMDFIS